MYYEIIARFDRRKMKSHGYVTNSLSDDIGSDIGTLARARARASKGESKNGSRGKRRRIESGKRKMGWFWAMTDGPWGRFSFPLHFSSLPRGRDHSPGVSLGPPLHA